MDYHAEINALKKRVEELESKLNIDTQICIGYCNQPTSDESGMCQPCRVKERIIDNELKRKFGR